MNEQRNDASLHEILSAVCDETATAEQIGVPREKTPART